MARYVHCAKHVTVWLVLLVGVSVAQTNTPTNTPTVTVTPKPCATFRLVLPDPLSNPPDINWAREMTRRLRNYAFADKCVIGSGEVPVLPTPVPTATAGCSCGNSCVVGSGCAGGQTINGGTGASDELLLVGSTNVSGGTIGMFDSDRMNVTLNALGNPRLIINGNFDPTDELVSGGIVPFVINADLSTDPIVAAFPMITANDAEANGSLILGIKARGTLATPLQTESGARLMTIAGTGYDTSNSLVAGSNPVQILLEQCGPAGSGFLPGCLFITSINAAGATEDRFKMDPEGRFSIGDSHVIAQARTHIRSDDSGVEIGLIVDVEEQPTPSSVDLQRWGNHLGASFNVVHHSVDPYGREGAGGPTPSVSSCGSGPSLSAGATDQTGTITVGTGSVTSCTLNFANTWDGEPACYAYNETQIQLIRVVTTTTTMVIDAGTSFDEDEIKYGCPIFERNTSTPTATRTSTPVATPTATPTV